MVAGRDVDLLHGPILSRILVFAFPVMITNILQNLFNAADMIIVGLSGVEGAIGAIGTTLAFINLIINIFMGLAVGAGIVVSRAVGEGKADKQEKAVHTALTTGFLFGILCSAVGLAVSRPVLVLLGDEGTVLELAVLYTKIYFLCVPCVALSNFYSIIFRAKGDSKTPLVAMGFSGILNVFLNLFFVLVLKMSVDGVAIATAISNLVSAFYMMLVLSKDRGPCRFCFSKLGIDRNMFKAILYNGIPSAIQSSLFSIANMTLQGSIIKLNNMYYPGGSVIIDGNSAGQSIEIIANTANGSITTSVMTAVSQHKGAEKNRRLKEVIKIGYITIFSWSLIFPSLILLFRHPLISLYVTDPAAVSIAEQRLVILLSFYLLQGFLDMGTGVARALGKSVSSALVSLFFMCIFRILWVFLLFPVFPTYAFINSSFPVTWLLCGAGQLVIILKELERLPLTEE